MEASHGRTAMPHSLDSRAQVIYWFGFVGEVDTDADLLLLESFPDGDCELMSHCALTPPR